MLPAATFALLLAATARAQESAPASPDPATVAAAAAEVDAARRLYAQGNTEEAREKLRAVLKLGLSPEVRQSALAYLGDLLYAEDGARAADPFLLALLDENPNYVMDPLDHPPAFSRHFDVLREARARQAKPPPPPPPPPKPAPWLALAPGGAHYFVEGDIAAGAAVATTQVALLVTNALLFAEISDAPKVNPEDPTQVESYRQLELATNLTAGAFYLSLLLPPAIEFSRWGSQTSVTLGPGSLQVAGQF